MDFVFEKMAYQDTDQYRCRCQFEPDLSCWVSGVVALVLNLLEAEVPAAAPKTSPFASHPARERRTLVARRIRIGSADASPAQCIKVFCIGNRTGVQN
jgi:hypothetical protein